MADDFEPNSKIPGEKEAPPDDLRLLHLSTNGNESDKQDMEPLACPSMDAEYSRPGRFSCLGCLGLLILLSLLFFFLILPAIRG